MELWELEEAFLSDFDLMIAVEHDRPTHVLGIGIKAAIIPLHQKKEMAVQRSQFLMTRSCAERLRDLLTEALQAPASRILN